MTHKTQTQTHIRIMSFVDRIKRFFAQTISSYGSTMNEPNPNWHMMAKRMMYDMVVFHSELVELESSNEVGSSVQPVNNEQDDQSSASFDVNWCTNSEVNFDFDVFEAGLESNEPVKSVYEKDESYLPQNTKRNSTEMKEEKQPSKKKQNIGKRDVSLVTCMDFTFGQTRFDVRNKVKDETISHIVESALRTKQTYNHNGLFFKVAKNWSGIIQKGLVVTSDGDFFVFQKDKGAYMKPVSQKDRFLYHDACKIHAPKLVYCSFIKNHPGLEGADEEDYRIYNNNGRWYDLNIDNLELRKINRKY